MNAITAFIALAIFLTAGVTALPALLRNAQRGLGEHISLTLSNQTWLGPLKKAVVDAQGHLRLLYWRGNQTMTLAETKG